MPNRFNRDGLWAEIHAPAFSSFGAPPLTKKKTGFHPPARSGWWVSSKIDTFQISRTRNRPNPTRLRAGTATTGVCNLCWFNGDCVYDRLVIAPTRLLTEPSSTRTCEEACGSGASFHQIFEQRYNVAAWQSWCVGMLLSDAAPYAGTTPVCL